MKNDNNNKFSIVLINLNNEHSIEETIRSLIQQNGDFELIIVDAGSSDNSLGIIKQFENICFVKTYYHSHYLPSLNINQAREIGVNLSSGNIICFVDSDCIYPNYWIEMLEDDFKKSEITAVFGPRFPDKGEGLGTLVRRFEGYKSRKYLCNEIKIFNKFSKDMFLFAGCNLAIRKDALQEINLFDKNFSPTSFEDVDLQIRLLIRGYILLFDPRIIIEHIHPLSFNSLLRKSLKSGAGLAILMSKYYETIPIKWSPINDLAIWLSALFIISFIEPSSYKISFFFLYLLFDGLKRIKSPQMFDEKLGDIAYCLILKYVRDIFIAAGFLSKMVSQKFNLSKIENMLLPKARNAENF